MNDPTPLRKDLPERVLAAVRTISQPVWGEPYRSGRGPAHYASGPYWSDELRQRADRWERQAAAARVVAEFMDPPEVVDLVAALRASVEAAKKRREALSAPLEMCLVGKQNGEPHDPHQWWYTSYGGGHQMDSDDPTEKGVKQYRCPGISEQP